MENPLISKAVLSGGTGTPIDSFQNGTKVTFHFKCETKDQVIDDSKEGGKAMELILGKKFKLEVWESCIKTMKLKEVAVFNIQKELVSPYPVIAKTLRNSYFPIKLKEPTAVVPDNHSCCASLSFKGSITGYDDLDNLIKNPEALKFTIEIVKVESPGEYEKETWLMSPDEKLESVPKLKEEGNELFQLKDYKLAADKYALALGRLENLLLREKPFSSDWNELDSMKIPLLLNFSQCKLIEGDYYSVIEHCSEVLKKDPDNIKALYRRGKAEIAVWRPEDAKRDLNLAMSLDKSLCNVIKKELNYLDQLEKEKATEDKSKYSKLFK